MSPHTVIRDDWKAHEETQGSSESIVKAVYHKCKICEVSLLCDKLSIRHHLKRKHEISLKEYCKQSSCIMAENKINRFPMELLSTYKVSETIRNLCEFTCKKCVKTFFSSRSFVCHVRYHHQKMTISLLPAISKGFSYKCKKCQSVMLCDKSIIQAHMNQRHGIKMFGQKKIEYDELCKQFLNTTPASSKIWRKTSIKSNSIPVREITSKIGNLCIYKCPKCYLSDINSWESLQSHCKRKHSNSIPFSSNLVVTARNHACLVCPMAVLSDRCFLKNHVRNKHKMTFLTYQKTFEKKGGETFSNFRTMEDSPGIALLNISNIIN